MEISRTLVGVGSPVELPSAIQRLPILTVLGQNLTCLLHVFERKEPCMRLLLVEGEFFYGFPFLACWRGLVTVLEALQIVGTCHTGDAGQHGAHCQKLFHHIKIIGFRYIRLVQR